MSSWKQSLDKLSSNSLLVSTTNNTLIRFYCPIPAICKTAVAGYNTGDRVKINGVYQKADDRLLYLIDGLKLPHHHFTLNI